MSRAILLLLFAAIWIGGVVVWVAGALKSRPTDKRMPWFARLWLAATATFILGVGGCFLLMTLAARSHLEDLASSPPQTILLRGSSGSRVLNGATETGTLMRLLSSGANVDGHHSSPVDSITISIGSGEDVYELGRDSDHPQEFWLSDGSGLKVRQFHSPALDVWLRSHWPPRADKAPTTNVGPP